MIPSFQTYFLSTLQPPGLGAFFRQQGYQIGSGTIESAAKQIGFMRMKVPGAIWNEQQAPLIAKARAAFLSDRWRSLPLAV
jgi:hypothetical protein